MSQDFADALIGRVKSADWFSKVGSGELPDCVRVANWAAAVSELTTDAYASADGESTGRLRQQVTDECRARRPADWAVEWGEFCKKYDTVVDQSGSIAEELASTTIAKAPIEKEVMEKVVVHFCDCLSLTLSFAELFGDDVENLHRTFMEFFLDGFFPCGYRGTYPGGKIVVY